MLLSMFCALSLASDVTIPVAGALTDAVGAPLQGTHPVTFQLWNAASGGAAIGETMLVTFQDGSFTAVLGASGGLTATVFSTPRWLGLTVDGVESARVPVGFAPRAAWAALAEHAATADALSAPYAWSDLDFTTAPGWAKSAPIAGNGIAISGTTFSLNTDVVDGRVTTGDQAHTGARTWAGTSTFNGGATFNQGFTLAGTSTFGGTLGFTGAPSFQAGFTSGAVSTFNASTVMNSTLTVNGVNEWPIVMRNDSATATNRNHFLAQRARAGGAVTTGDTLGGLGMGGKYDATNYASGWNGGAEISAFAAEPWTASARGADLILKTTSAGATTIADRLRIGADGTNKFFGPLEVTGSFIRTIARVQGTHEDGNDNAPLGGRLLSVTKRFADTGIRVTWSDNFRVINNNKACAWEVLFNDQRCTNPAPAMLTKYEGNTNSNRHDPAAFVATCFGLSAGTINITTRVMQAPSYTGSDCHTGWNGQLFSIEAEEVR